MVIWVAITHLRRSKYLLLSTAASLLSSCCHLGSLPHACDRDQLSIRWSQACSCDNATMKHLSRC